MKFLTPLLMASAAMAHTIDGMSSIKAQLQRRAEIDLVDTMFENLPYKDIDYVNKHLEVLTAFNGTKCDKCKNKMRYARQMMDSEPENQHLVSMTLFQYCLALNSNNPTKCDTVDFFLMTQDISDAGAIGSFDSGLHHETSINLYDNDFMQMIKRFNFSSELDLDYYCYFKGGYCDLPDLIDVEAEYDIQSWFPAKEEKHYSEPEYATKENRDRFNVLHVTDFHTQFRYTVGAEAKCDQKTCCMIENYNEDLPDMTNYNFTDYIKKYNPEASEIDLSFYPDAHYDEEGNFIPGEYYDLPAGRGWDSAVAPAGTWGGYKCDSPIVLVNHTMKYAAELKDANFEFSIFTGDLVDHDKIHCTPNVTKEAEILGFAIMKEYLGDIPVFAALGNHDTFPYGQLAPHKYDTTNAYQYNADLMSQIWTRDGWLDESEQAEVRDHYSGFATETRRGLKVIALNSNAYYQKNLWNYINLRSDPDPFGQWAWLIKELVESEQKGQRVWLMAHIPSSDGDVLPIQSAIFHKIVERFSPYTIANIFYGHTHKDQFKIFFSEDSADKDQLEKVPTNMAYIGQSVTPRKYFNPAFKYYEIEDESFNVMNTYNYYAKLNETFINGAQEPSWELEYTARELYDSESTWPESAPLNATFWNEYVLKNIYNSSNLEFNQLFADLQFRMTDDVIVCDNEGSLSDECWDENWCEIGIDNTDEFLRCLRGD